MKRISPLLLSLALLFSLSGCSARPLPDGMDEETAGQAGRDMVALLTARDYQGVAEAFREDMAQQYSVTPEAIGAIMETVSPAGSYVKTERTLAVRGGSKDFTEPYASVIVYCEHTQGNVIYEFSFDTQLDLIGLQVKRK